MADGSIGGGLSKLAETYRSLASLPSQICTDAAKEIKEAIELQFDEGCDPYGTPWLTLAPSTIAHGRFPPPGTDTRALRESITVTPMSGSGIQIDVGEDYGVFYNIKRPILPSGDMPFIWKEAIRKAKENAIKRRLGK